MPKRYVTSHPAYIANICVAIDLPKRSMKNPVTYAHQIYPKMNPPAGPNIIPNPPEKPENTGIPIAPIRTKIIWLLMPKFAPNSPAAKKMETCVKLIGTRPIGIDIWDNTALKAENNAHNTILLVFIFRFTYLSF